MARGRCCRPTRRSSTAAAAKGCNMGQYACACARNAPHPGPCRSCCGRTWPALRAWPAACESQWTAPFRARAAPTPALGGAPRPTGSRGPGLWPKRAREGRGGTWMERRPVASSGARNRPAARCQVPRALRGVNWLEIEAIDWPGLGCFSADSTLVHPDGRRCGDALRASRERGVRGEATCRRLRQGERRSTATRRAALCTASTTPQVSLQRLAPLQSIAPDPGQRQESTYELSPLR